MVFFQSITIKLFVKTVSYIKGGLTKGEVFTIGGLDTGLPYIACTL